MVYKFGGDTDPNRINTFLQENLWILFLLLTAILFFTTGNSQPNFNLFINISIGLLLFIGIFYPLVIYRDLEYKQKQAESNLYESKIPKIKLYLKDILKILNKKGHKKDKYKNLGGSIEKLHDEMEYLSYKLDKIKLLRPFRKAVASSISAFLIASIGSAIPYKLVYISKAGTIFSLGSVMIILIMMSFYYIIILLLVWDNINKN